MSRIAELIGQLCPNGVSFQFLGDIIERSQGGGTPERGTAEFWNGEIPWASVGDLSVPGLTITKTRASITAEGLARSSSNVVRAGDLIVATKISPGRIKIAGSDIAINQDLRGLTPKPEIDSKFLAYYFQTLDFVGNGTIVKAITSKTLERTRVPVPPIEVQREVVEVLDRYTGLEAEISAALADECAARRAHYSHVRDELLTYPEATTPYMTVGDLTSKVSSGRNRLRGSDGPVRVFGSTGLIGYSDVAAYSGEALLVARVGANAGAVNAVSGDFDVTDNTLVLELLPSWDFRFAYHQLMHANINQYAKGAGQPLVTGAQLKSLRIAFPPLNEQRRVGALLDTLSSLVVDLTAALPSEIAARRKQYEYYRGKLLTFEEAAA